MELLETQLEFLEGIDYINEFVHILVLDLIFGVLKLPFILFCLVC